jgi:ankyrin repeat protein
MTLLYTRVDENNLPFANLLERAIKNDAEINEQDDSGDTALHIAIENIVINLFLSPLVVISY